LGDRYGDGRGGEVLGHRQGRFGREGDGLRACDGEKGTDSGAGGAGEVAYGGLSDAGTPRGGSCKEGG
jgi:hypothetical protein